MCIFCEIVAGRIPCAKIYEDDVAIVFLDIRPVEKGHTLVVLRRHCPTLLDAPPEDLKKLMGVVQKVSRAIVACGLGEGFNLSQNNGKVAGQEVPHLHFHIIPRGGRGIHAATLDAVALSIRSALEQGDAP